MKWMMLISVGVTVAAVACSGDSDNTTAGTGSGGSGASGQSVGGSGGSGASGGQGGGVAGNGGSGGVGQGGGSSKPECAADADCNLVNDCCSCAGVPNGSDLPCDVPECLVPMCSQFEPPTIGSQCRLRQCVTTVDCDLTQVTCKALEPTCPAGQMPTFDGVSCYGPCADILECASVDNCDRCEAGTACVAEVAMLGPVFHCIPIPAACNGTPTCDCMGDSVCDDTFDSCSENKDYLACNCTAC